MEQRKKKNAAGVYMNMNAEYEREARERRKEWREKEWRGKNSKKQLLCFVLVRYPNKDGFDIRILWLTSMQSYSVLDVYRSRRASS